MKNLRARIERYLSSRGKSVDLDALRPLIEMEEQTDGKGQYISKWDEQAGPLPSTSDGFSEHELHRLT